MFRVDFGTGSLPTDLPTIVKDLIADSHTAVQEGRLFSPLGLAVASGGHISAIITNGYGERQCVDLCTWL